MILNANLLPIYKNALQNDSESILKIADAFRFGNGVAKNDKLANQWYEKLLSFNDLPYVQYEYCYLIAGDAAYDRNNFKLAYNRYNKAIRLFVKKFGVTTAFQKLSEINALNFYNHLKILNDTNC